MRVREPVATYSLEAEEHLIACVLRDPRLAAQLITELRRTDFFDGYCGEGFSAIDHLERRSPGGADHLSFRQYLEQGNRLHLVGGLAKIEEWLHLIASTSRFELYLGIVKERSKRRTATAAVELAAAEMHTNPAPTEQVLDGIAHRISRLAQDGVKGESRSTRDLMRTMLDRALSGKPANPTISTGLAGLDDLRLLQDGSITYLAGRPGQGKTALALCVAHHAAFTKDLPVLFASLEMTEDQVLRRLLSLGTGAPHQQFLTGCFSSTERAAIREFGEHPGFDRLRLAGETTNSVAGLRGETIRHFRDRNGLVIVDYVQLMVAPIPTYSRVDELTQISRDLKRLARELQVPVLALSQLNRECEARSDRRPRSSDLKDSGALEQDADTVALLHREEVFGRTAENAGKAELLIDKSRHGERTTLPLLFDGPTMRFYDDCSESSAHHV